MEKIISDLKPVKKFFCLIVIILICWSTLAGLTPQEIMRSGSPYFWGKARCDDFDEASERARTNLSANISTSVSSSFESIIQETNMDSHEFLESVVTTYTSFSFRELQPIVDRDGDGNYIVLYFLHRDDLQQEYDERRQLIFNIYNTAINNRNSANISRALQYFYYALILMNSVPDRNIRYEGENLRVVIPIAIQEILDNVQFIYDGDIWDSESIRTARLMVTYNEIPVQSLDFSYLERGTMHRSEARDGRAVCDLMGASVSYNDLDVEIEYRYASSRELIPIVAELWQGVRRPSFNNRRNISLRLSEEQLAQIETQPAEAAKIITPEEEKYTIILANETDSPFTKEIRVGLTGFLDVISTGSAADIKEHYGSDPFLKEKMTTLIRHNQPRLVDETFEIEINQVWDGWEVRSIPVSCLYPSISKQTVEYMVLDFDNEGNLRDVNFKVFDELYQTYVNTADSLETDHFQRQILIKFLEKYRTAFMNRDIETLEKIFAEEAVIIVGRVLEPSPSSRGYEIDRDMEQIEYLQFSKEEYLTRQRAIFAAQRDIHLGFDTFRVMKKDRETDVYGISMRQQYASSGYADEGHLFLLIDFLEEDPTIYVRSWQPGEWSDEQMLNMSDFRVLD